MSQRGAVFALLVAVLWIPELRLLIAGNMALRPALERMVLAVVVAWAGVSLVSRVVAAYQARNSRVDADDGPSRS